MKKRIILVISSILLVVLSAISLVACAPSKPDKFFAELAVGGKWTVEQHMPVQEGDKVVSKGYTRVAHNKNNYYFVEKNSYGYVVTQKFIVKEKDNDTLYIYTSSPVLEEMKDLTKGKWTKETDADKVKEVKESIISMGMSLINIAYPILPETFDKADVQSKMNAILEKGEKGRYHVLLDSVSDKTFYMTIKSGRLHYFRSYEGVEDDFLLGSVALLSGSIAIPKEAKGL